MYSRFEHDHNVMRIFLHIIFSTIIVVILGSCSARNELVTHAMGYNEALADSHNKLILLNVMRAAYRYPMYFSDTGNLTAQAKKSLELGLDYNFGSDSLDSHTLKPKISYDGGALSVLYHNLNREEFTNSIIFREVTLNQLNFYINNGWNKNLIYMLLIDSFSMPVENLLKLEELAYFVCRNGVRDKYKIAYCDNFEFQYNNPSMLKGRLDRHEIRDGRIYVRNFGADKSISDDFRYYISLFKILDARIYDRRTGRELKRNRKIVRNQPSYDIVPETERVIDFENAFVRRQVNRAGGSAAIGLKVNVRSVQSVMYYVGELIRAQLGSGGSYVPDIPVGAPQLDESGRYYFVRAPMVRVKRGASVAASVQVKLGRQMYHVPAASIDGTGHRTLQVFALINQLLTLSTSSDSIPQQSTIIVEATN